MLISWIDWFVVIFMLVILVWMGIYTKKYTVSVADFLAANRCARRYLLSVAQGMAAFGAISIIAGFEMYYAAGFTPIWWGFLGVTTSIVISLSGWIFYRFRQTRALTLAQFLEIRYSKRFRVFAGIVAFLSGVINFGIFPSVGARFFIHFCGFPDTIFLYTIIMVVLIAFALFFTFIGGQIAVMVTDFIQGAFTNIIVIIALFILFFLFDWSQIYEAISVSSEGASRINPFDTKNAQGFNIWYYLIFAFTLFYTTGVWQGNQGYNAAALNAHEARMGKILSTWRAMTINLFILIVPICAYTFMNHPDFVQMASAAKIAIANITDPQLQTQMTTTIALKSMLPIGAIGGIMAVMLCAFIGNCDTYLHSWGSIFIQDIILPFRKKALSSQEHLKMLRLAITGVAVFILFFSLIFRQTEYIYMFFMITGAIFIGGAGVVVVGGLYWKRGTTAAAWSAMITGSSLSVGAVIVQQIHESYPFTGRIIGYIASQNGAVLSFYASCIAILIYIIVSLVGKPQYFNLDKMLHRGIYAVEDNNKKTRSDVNRLWSALGGTNEFNRSDCIIYIITIGWTFFWAAVFVIGTIYAFITHPETESWMQFWWYYIILTLIISTITTVWFTIGGILDVRHMFGLLINIKRDDNDDGTVLNSVEEAHNKG